LKDRIAHWLVEFGLLVKREYKSTTRDYTVLVLRILIAIFFGLTVSFLLFQVGQHPPPGPANPSHVGLVATLAIFAMVSSGQALLIAYANERPIMLREHASGLYAITAYSLSKDVLEYPIVLTVVLIYLTLGYLIGGMVGSYLLLLLGMVLIGLSAAAISFLFAAVTTTVSAGAQVGTYLLIVQVILSGFFIAVDQVPQVLRWIQWINPLRYGLSIMFLAEFNNQPGSAEFFSANQINPSMIVFYIFMLIGLIIILRISGLIALWYRCHKSVV
jgi:hypothetical protein